MRVHPEAHYETREAELGLFAELFVFSDGIYEVALPDGSELGWSEFARRLDTIARRSVEGSVDAVVESVRSLTGARAFEDDVSVLRVEFHPGEAVITPGGEKPIVRRNRMQGA